jgi:2-oxoglutarate dehydrogenase E2 component (dihydrolipoamide succinyltransferase)
MLKAVTHAPHVTALFEADFTALTAHKKALAAKGTKLSYTAYLLKAAAEAMAVAPAVNGRWAEDRIIVSARPSTSVSGTALGDKGLVVPVVRDCASLSLTRWAPGLDDLTTRARAGRLERGDVANGSFTISNHGVSGSLLAAPIILHQGPGRDPRHRQAAEEGGGVEPRWRGRYRHPPNGLCYADDRPRVIDGHQTNAWLSRFVEIIEELACRCSRNKRNEPPSCPLAARDWRTHWPGTMTRRRWPMRSPG